PIRDTLSEGFSYFVTSVAAPVAWSMRRVGLAPTGSYCPPPNPSLIRVGLWFIHHSGTKLIEAEQFESVFSVFVKHTQIVSFSEVSSHDREMHAVPLLRKSNRNLVSDKFVDALFCKHCDQCAVEHGGVARQDNDRT